MSESTAPRGVTVFSPLARAIMDRFHEGLVLFDTDGRVTYANQQARRLLDEMAGDNGLSTKSLLPRLGRRGGRIERLEAGEVLLGHAVFLPVSGPDTLADRERRAIVETLHATGWKLTETARRLGISRTTLWRRLRDYGVQPQEAEAGD